MIIEFCGISSVPRLRINPVDVWARNLDEAIRQAQQTAVALSPAYNQIYIWKDNDGPMLWSCRFDKVLSVSGVEVY